MGAMRLRVRLPTRLALDEPVSAVVARSLHGSFGLLPRHVDFVTPILPGLLRYERANGEEHYLGVDEGVLVKCGSDVMVSVRDAVPAADEETVRAIVRDRFESLTERERRARAALTQLEAGFIRRFMEQRGERAM